MANDHIADDRKKVRLIDANALDERLEILKVRFKAQGRNTVAEDYNFVQTVLMTAPTVDAVEVVRAHWEDGCAIHNGKEVYKSIDCSHCNEIFKTEDREYWKKRFKVCPFCGAIMDGERRTE